VSQCELNRGYHAVLLVTNPFGSSPQSVQRQGQKRQACERLAPGSLLSQLYMPD
jgi:hypothetical protein